MHTTTIGKYCFLHDGDYGVETRIIKNIENGSVEEMKIETEVLINFVTNIARRKAISKLEQMTPEQLLNSLLI